MIGILKRFFGSKDQSGDEPGPPTVIDDKSSEAPYMAAAAFYLAVILLIGIPMWFYTCSVTRYSTPPLIDLKSKLLDSPLSLHLDISIIQLSRDSSPKTDQEHYHDDESDKDSLSRFLRTNLPKNLKTSSENITYNIDWRVRRPTYKESSIFKTHLTRDATTDSPKEESLADLEVKLRDIHKNSSKFRLFMYLIPEKDHLAFCDQSRVHSYTINMERFVYLCPSSALAKPDDHSSVVSLVTGALEEIYVNTVDLNRVKQILDSRVDLLFTLMPESMDNRSNERLNAVDDKIHHIFERNVRKKFPELKHLVNIRPITQNHLDQSKITREQLPHLFRSFEFRSSTQSAKNVYHVLLLIPKDTAQANQSAAGPLSYIESEDSKSLLIVEDDKTLVLGLRAIIRRLSGLLSPNICKSCLVRRDIFFCNWEIDAIMGALTILKLNSIYSSLSAIDLQVTGIKIPKDVAATVRESHKLALRSIDCLKTQRIFEAHTLTSEAYELSEAAFYDPSLLESLYFPDDLKYAIYLPFFLPLAYPIILSIVKLLKYAITSLYSYRKLRKEKVE